MIEYDYNIEYAGDPEREKGNTIMKLYLHEGHDHEHEHSHAHETAGKDKEMATLAALVTHWIRHGEDHVDSYKEWADKAAENDRNDVTEAINEAIAFLEKANDSFRKASELMK